MNSKKKKMFITVFLPSVLLMLSACGATVTTTIKTKSDTGTVDTKPDTGTEDTKDDTGTSETTAETGVELIPGGDFTETSDYWGVYTESGGSANFEVKGGQGVLSISDPGKVGHGVQLYCDGFELLEGGKYRFTVKISSDVPRTFEWRVQQNGGDYHAYYPVTGQEIGPEEKELCYEFVMKEPSDPAPRMCFNFGDEDRAQNLSKHTINLDDVSLILTDASLTKPIEREGNMEDININQLGYKPSDEKRAVVRGGVAGTAFCVVDAKSGSKVYEGKIEEGTSFGSSGDTVGYADLTAVKDAGTYKVCVDGLEDSYEFSVSEDVYNAALTDSLRMLYLQRCGCALPRELAGDFEHAPCHTEEARIYGSNEYIEVTGGWHDAGDYGRYTVPGAKAAADLMLAYEAFPDVFGDDTNIPESHNGIPDILDEARYELEWLHKMQGKDGGVYHKVTGLNFDGFVRPDECTEKLYVLPESKTATADFAAVNYMAARVYEGIDKEFSDKCKNMADRAVSAYIAHINDRNFVNPKDVLTGEYADGNSTDEFLWAVLEGYKTTGDSSLIKQLEKVDLSRIVVDGFGWEDMSGYAYYAYLTSKDRPVIGMDVEKRFFDMCDDAKTVALSEAYGSSIKDDYPWGSNMIIANNGMAFQMAYSLTKNDEYILAAKRQLDYLLGTNCTSYCFLTGYGTKSPHDPHHRPSQAIGECMKGMLVGGPDSGLHDPYAKSVLQGLPKARCYVDNSQSYSCNEITIYWNSPLVHLMAGFDR